MSQSVKLTEFYQTYSKWLDEGAPEGKPFNRYAGLCSNLYLWVYYDHPSVNYYILDEEMKTQFIKAGLNHLYPFCTSVEYDQMLDNNSQHLCEARVKWVKEHANG